MSNASVTSFKHPLPIGFKLRSIEGKNDLGPNNWPRKTGPNALGEVVSATNYPGEGWSYNVVFPLSGVAVILEEHSELNDLLRYRPATIDVEKLLSSAQEFRQLKDKPGYLSGERLSEIGVLLRETALIADTAHLSAAQGYQFTDDQISVLRSALQVASEKYAENVTTLKTIPGQDRLAAQFEKQTADANAMIAVLDNEPLATGHNLSGEKAESVFVVQGEHWSIPGLIMKVCARQEIAQHEALSIVNILRSDVDLPPETEPTNYEQALEEAFEKRAEDTGMDIDEIRLEAGVSIIEQPLIRQVSAEAEEDQDDALQSGMGM